jgi:MFS transporter, AAHS family, 4-hydroxybenzoate transporter
VARRIDVEALIDNQKFGGFTLRVVLLALLALIIDGYDVQVMSFAAPSLLKAWHLNRAAFAPVLGASLIGILFGAPMFGWIGDRVGRKTSIIVSSIVYGLMSLSCLLARDLQTLMILRFLIGVGMGGVFPNAIALAAELAPRRMRAGMAAVISVGITIGGVIPGLMVAQLPPGPVFRQLFLIGGVAPLLLAALLTLALPESVAFLIKRGGQAKRALKILRQIDPTLEVGPDAELALPGKPSEEKVGLAAIFAGQLKLVTPLLWVMFSVTLLCIFMLTSWMPLLLEASGFTPQQAAATNSLFQVGGVVGGVLTALLLGRFGVRVVASLFVICLVSVAVVARAGLPDSGLAVAIFFCGFGLIGAQGALNGSAGLAYPTPARSRGLGMALGVGRVGSVIGPFLAGATVAAGVTSARDLFLLPLVPLAIGAVAAFIVMGRLDLRHAAGSKA